MELLPLEIYSKIYCFIPLMGDKLGFIRVKKEYHCNLKNQFCIDIKKIENHSDKEWALIGYLIKEDYIAINIISKYLSKNTLICLFIYVLNFDDLKMTQCLLNNSFIYKFISTLDHEFIDKQLLNIIKEKNNRYLN